MAKKKSSNSEPQGGLKKGKIKRKQMFAELQTLHEKKIAKKQPPIKRQPQDVKREESDYEAMSEEQLPQQELNAANQVNKVNRQQKSIQEICSAVNQLMVKNKIGVKNAFEVPIIDIQDMTNMTRDETEASWKNLSSTLENDSKIYGYRVDAIHNITYSILNIMARRETSKSGESAADGQIGNNPAHLSIDSGNFGLLKDSFLENIDMEKTLLEKNPNNINLSVMDCSMSSDPLLERTKRQFDEPGLKGLLMNSLQIDRNLSLSLSASLQHRKASFPPQSQSAVLKEISFTESPLRIFESTEKIHLEVFEILTQSKQSLKQNIVSSRELEEIWKNVGKRNFNDWTDKNKVWLDVDENEYCEKLDLMIDENSENLPLFENSEAKKYIGEYLKMKNAPKKLVSDKEIDLEGEKWLNEIDRKFLGMKTAGRAVEANSLKPFDSNPGSQPRTLHDFTFDAEMEDSDSVLKQQPIPKQFREQIEDRYLTTIRPFSEFKIFSEKILTLREQPQTQFLDEHNCAQMIAEEDPGYLHEDENRRRFEKQIDVKRQMTSIRQMKETIYSSIKSQKQTTFEKVFAEYRKTDNCQADDGISDAGISPALCFLTLLHLVNEHNLELGSVKKGQKDRRGSDQENFDFVIRT